MGLSGGSAKVLVLKGTGFISQKQLYFASAEGAEGFSPLQQLYLVSTEGAGGFSPLKQDAKIWAFRPGSLHSFYNKQQVQLQT
jgi:hypothetical protein